jgi:hypothetical protein
VPDPAEIRFSGTVADAGRGGGRWVEVPPAHDVKGTFGEARPPVEGSVNGLPYRSRLAVYGGHAYLGLSKELRAEAGLDVGDPVQVVLRRDDAPRVVELPPELEQAFGRDAELKAIFDALAFTHRREYAEWIASAKRPETREKRSKRALEMLREGTKHP